MKALSSLTALLTAALAAAPAAAAMPNLADGKLVVEAGRIITQAGSEIVDGVIVIENGRITAVGPADEVEKPWDAQVIGDPEWVAFPGFVEAHTSRGMDRSNENVDVAPFLDIRDSLDPVSFYFEDALRWGITTINIQQGSECVIGARGMIVRPTGWTVEEMTVRPNYGLKISASPKRGMSRSTQMQAIRTAFSDLQRYLEELVTNERDERGYAAREALFQGRELDTDEKSQGRKMESTAWNVDGLELIPRGAIDEKQAPLLDVVEGRHQVYFSCARPIDVPHALEIARENGFLARTVLYIDDSCWEAADLIAEAGVPVILSGLVHTRRDPITGEEVETFVPKVLADKGIRFAIASRNSTNQSLWYQAALAIGHGLDRQVALDAVTRVPAEIIGMGNEVGSLEVGKHGNVVLYSGDPLSVTSTVQHVVIEGNAVYDRATDLRTKHLTDGSRPPGTIAEGADVGGGHEHEDEDEHGDDDEEHEEEDED